MQDVKFYVCPVCGNVTISTGNAEVTCCGRKLRPERVGQSRGIKAEVSGSEYIVSCGHPMTKDHYFSFFAAESDDGVQYVRLYPESKAEARFTRQGVKRIYVYCTVDGLYAKDL
ncbi:MAG: hypothetical protein J5822_06705 [Eubacteriaceae bacterium]|nr:hypothetical protein [Eubacteriaceae bacterium]